MRSSNKSTAIISAATILVGGVHGVGDPADPTRALERLDISHGGHEHCLFGCLHDGGA